MNLHQTILLDQLEKTCNRQITYANFAGGEVEKQLKSDGKLYHNPCFVFKPLNKIGTSRIIDKETCNFIRQQIT